MTKLPEELHHILGEVAHPSPAFCGFGRNHWDSLNHGDREVVDSITSLAVDASQHNVVDVPMIQSTLLFTCLKQRDVRVLVLFFVITMIDWDIILKK